MWGVSPASGVQGAQPPAQSPLPLFWGAWGVGAPAPQAGCRGRSPLHKAPSPLGEGGSLRNPRIKNRPVQLRAVFVFLCRQA